MENITLLIVDDDQNILKTLERFFSLKENITVITESNPLNVFEIIKEKNVHIALIDIEMPEKSGLTLLKEIREINPLIQIIIITAYASLERVLISFKSGANDFVMKPFDSLEEVWNIVEVSIKKIERWRKVLEKILNQNNLKL